MKIGFSFGRCLRDIVLGHVNIDDVVVIVTRTNLDREHIEGVIAEYAYRRDYLGGLPLDRCLAAAYELYDSGRLHQPRKYRVHRAHVPDDSIWFDLFPTALSDNEKVKMAWDKYRMALMLTGEIENNTTDQKIY